MRIPQYAKKALVLTGLVVPLCFINVASLRAQTSEGGAEYLAIIASNTTKILEKVNNIPEYLEAMGRFILNMQAIDNGPPTANLQASFDILGQAFVQNVTAQTAVQQQLTADIVGKSLTDFTQQPQPPILNVLPNINDLSYASLLGAPPAQRGTFSPYNYVKYASGANIKHIMPSRDWSNPNSINTYQPVYTQYYNTIMSIESFGAYVLSNMLVENQNGSQSTSAIQNSLVAQASNSEWLKQVGGEEIGKVLRQLLVFQSQTYVLLTQLLQTQKQLLTATVMNNTLLILTNRNNEVYLAAKAQGVTPTI